MKSETPTDAEVIRKWRKTSYISVLILAVVSVGIFVLNQIMQDFIEQATRLCTGITACPPMGAEHFSILINLFAMNGMIFSLIFFLVIRKANNGKAPNWWGRVWL